MVFESLAFTFDMILLFKILYNTPLLLHYGKKIQIFLTKFSYS